MASDMAILNDSSSDDEDESRFSKFRVFFRNDLYPLSMNRRFSKFRGFFRNDLYPLSHDDPKLSLYSTKASDLYKSIQRFPVTV